MKRIGVIGDAVCSEKIMGLAEEVGREIAKRKGVLICGGLTGVMEGAARGAKKEGGLTIGIIPSESADDANPFIDIPIVTGLRDARNVIVVRSSEAIIAIQGKYGTLSEIAFALKFKVPVIGLHTWDITQDIIIASNAVDAVDKAFNLIQC
ncbi:MAG: TIGR00725 family protein [Thermodesulfobacteriota bacterium]|jgi:uncharacterized protein (TIGR00725 family)|nr:MAG: TIGR00725 family protein [Thermodesulfobacteriota bacterium]